jgi:protein-tyrosine-phosphatase
MARELGKRGISSVMVHSAGFVGPDRSSPPEALAVALERGLDMKAHRSKLITGQALQLADLVIVMSPEQAIEVKWRGAGPRSTVLVLGDLDPDPIEARTIRDPWNCDAEVFRSSYQRIDRCVAELMRVFPVA